MISNTATPKYYGRFRDAVVRGEIPVCEPIVLEMNRIDALIRDPRYYYDSKMVEAFIRFCETELTLADGSDVKLLDTFKLWAEQIFGWYEFRKEQVYEPYKTKPGGHYVWRTVKKRLIKKMYLIVSRSAAKTMFLSFIQNFFLNCDPSTTHQITTAPTMKQGEAVLEPIRTSILRARGPYFQFLTQGSINNTTGNKFDRVKLASTKKGVQNFITGSTIEVLPMEIDKLQGWGAKVATVDEWLSGDTRENPITAIEQGAIKNSNGDYIIISASSEGTVRNGIGDSIKMELMDILKGKYPAPHTSIWYYKLDDPKEVGNPALWMKANPNIKQLNKWDEFQQQVVKAEHNPDERNDIMAKMFGIPMEGYTYFFTFEETQIVKRNQDFWRMSCSLGVDLSRGDDFCAFTFLFPLGNGAFGIKVRSYITIHTLDSLPTATRQKYQQFINEGSLVIMDNPKFLYLDIQEVYDDLSKYIDDNEYDVVCMGYDVAYAKEFITNWERDNGPRGIEKVRQGALTESVPLGELKNLAREKRLWFDEKLMEYGMGNCVVLSDPVNGMRKLRKDRRDKKIDNVAALLDAWVAYKVNKENF